MFIDDLVTILTQAGVGTAGTTIFWSSKAPIPTGDGPYLSIIETGGTDPWLVHNAGSYYQRPSAQILARGKSYDATRNMIKNAYNALVRKRNVTINSVWYVSIDIHQEPFDLAVDDSGRIRYAFNITAVKRP